MSREKQVTDIGGSADPELLDQGEQIELARVLEWRWPLKFRLIGPGTGSNNESMMEMRDRGDVPGVTGQGTRQKTVRVVDEMRDNCFDDLQRNFGICVKNRLGSGLEFGSEEGVVRRGMVQGGA